MAERFLIEKNHVGASTVLATLNFLTFITNLCKDNLLSFAYIFISLQIFIFHNEKELILFI